MHGGQGRRGRSLPPTSSHALAGMLAADGLPKAVERAPHAGEAPLPTAARAPQMKAPHFDLTRNHNRRLPELWHEAPTLKSPTRDVRLARLHASTALDSSHPRHSNCSSPPATSSTRHGERISHGPTRHREPSRPRVTSSSHPSARIHAGAARQRARNRRRRESPPNPNHRAPRVPHVPGGQSVAFDAYFARYPTGRRAQTAFVIPCGHQPCRSNMGSVTPLGSQHTT